MIATCELLILIKFSYFVIQCAPGLDNDSHVMSSEILLAVLPFQSSGQESSKVIQNFEEDLAFHLSKFHGLSVLSYYSTCHLTLLDHKQLLQYEVSHVVTGAYRYQEDAMTINVQLIEFPAHKIVYNQRFEYNEEEIFSTLDQAVLQVTNLLRDQIDQSILSHSYRKPFVELEAYELFLMGNAYLKKGTPEDDEKARSYFQKALNKQPDYARAFSGISSSYFNEWSCQLWDRWEISQQGAKKYALKAIALDENDYVSLSILGRCLLFERDFEQAEYYLRRSLQMNNNDASVLLEIAFSLMFLGYNRESVDLYERACQLNPLNEGKYLSVGATVLFENGDFEKALEIGRKLDPHRTYIDFPVYMAAASYYLNNEKDALIFWDQFLVKFQNHIYFSKKNPAKDALLWHVNMNPYKHPSRLTAFWDFIKGYHSSGVSIGSQKPENNTGIITIDHDQVRISYGNKTAFYKRTKGLIDIAVLLDQSPQEIHCMELMGGKQVASDPVHVLDEKAKRNYQNRILELEAEVAEAGEMNDQHRVNELRAEYEELMDHLSKSLGLDGKSRKVASSADKARAAVTLRIREGIKKIAAKNDLINLFSWQLISK